MSPAVSKSWITTAVRWSGSWQIWTDLAGMSTGGPSRASASAGALGQVIGIDVREPDDACVHDASCSICRVEGEHTTGQTAAEPDSKSGASVVLGWGEYCAGDVAGGCLVGARSRRRAVTGCGPTSPTPTARRLQGLLALDDRESDPRSAEGSHRQCSRSLDSDPAAPAV